MTGLANDLSIVTLVFPCISLVHQPKRNGRPSRENPCRANMAVVAFACVSILLFRITSLILLLLLLFTL